MGDKVPLVSVGMPVYNAERFVAAAIDSILGQTVADIELIIADNASTDSTAQICRECAARDDRVRYFRHPENIGAPRNWNFVAGQARAPYFKWASANDYCAPTLVADCVARLQAHPDAVLSYSPAILVDETTGAPQPYDGDIALLDDAPSSRLHEMLTRWRLNHAASGVIRTAALRHSPLIRTYPSGDMILLAELALKGKFILLPERLFFRRIGASSFSSKLPADELRRFLDPAARRARAQSWLQPHVDLLMVVLRARIPSADRWRALAMVARGLYWSLAAPRKGNSEGAAT